jgi:hypothetical protein
MADRGIRTAGKNRRHLPAELGNRPVADEVDPAMDRMQPPSPNPRADRLGAEPEREQLPTCHDPVLALRQRGDPQIDATRGGSWSHENENPALAVGAPL